MRCSVPSDGCARRYQERYSQVPCTDKTAIEVSAPIRPCNRRQLDRGLSGVVASKALEPAGTHPSPMTGEADRLVPRAWGSCVSGLSLRCEGTAPQRSKLVKPADLSCEGAFMQRPQLEDEVTNGIRGFFSPKDKNGEKYASAFGVTLTGVCYAVGGLAFISALINLWPAVDPAASQAVAKSVIGTTQASGSLNAQANAAATSHHVRLFWGAYGADFNKSSGLLMLALLMGAIGGYAFALSNLVSEIMDQRFFARNGWFYALRPLVGAILGLLLYFAFRAGFANSSADASTASNIDPYGVALVTALAGLFSKQALDKLQTVFGAATGSPPPDTKPAIAGSPPAGDGLSNT